MEKLEIQGSLFYLFKGPYLYTRIKNKKGIFWYKGHLKSLWDTSSIEILDTNKSNELESEFNLANGENHYKNDNPVPSLDEVKHILFNKRKRWYDNFQDAETAIEECHKLLQNGLETDKEQPKEDSFNYLG